MTWEHLSIPCVQAWTAYCQVTVCCCAAKSGCTGGGWGVLRGELAPLHSLLGEHRMGNVRQWAVCSRTHSLSEHDSSISVASRVWACGWRQAASFPEEWHLASSLIPRGMTSCQQPHRHVVLRNDSLWMRACSCSCSPVPVVAAKPNLFAAEYSTWSSMHICPATQCMRTLISFSHTHIHTSS